MSYEAFFCFCTVLEMELLRTWHLGLECAHPPRALCCQSICHCFDNFAATEHHQYHLETVVPLNKSPVKSLHTWRCVTCPWRLKRVLEACFAIGFILLYFLYHYLPHCSQISGPLKGALYRYCTLFMRRQRQLDEATVSFLHSDQKTEKKPREYMECWISHCCRL